MSDAHACVVTGYIRLDLPNRSHDEYQALGHRLVRAVMDAGHPVFIGDGRPQDCWHWKISDGVMVPQGNPEKDTRGFHAVQHEKTLWVADAAEGTDSDILVWLDFGLLHVPGITEKAVVAFVDRVATSAPRDRIGMASIWGEPLVLPFPTRVSWHCAGGVFTAPRHLARQWHEAVVDAALRLRSRGWATWEVNDWAEAWRARPDIVRAWHCDHDASLLEEGP